MIGPLQQSMRHLGAAAVAQALKMAELSAKPNFLEFKEVIREHVDQVLHAAIAFTSRLVSACRLGTHDESHELEEKLIARLDNAAYADSTAFQEAVEALFVSVRDYSCKLAALADHCATTSVDLANVSTEVHDQGHRLARAAVAFTMQLMIASSPEPAGAREQSREMEKWLIAKLDAAYGPLKDPS